MLAKRRLALVLFAASSAGLRSVVRGDITFLDHFNDLSSFNINPANGDYSAGTGIATVVGSALLHGGFFPGSTPVNGALSLSSGDNSVQFPAFDGNVLTDITTGGITVGCWFKMGSASNTAQIFVIGNPLLSYAYADADYGSVASTVQAGYCNNTSVVTSPGEVINATQWNYLAATFDLTNEALTEYVFNSTGALVGSPVSSPISVPQIWEIGSALTYEVSLGGQITGSITMDEFSIDNTVLSQAQLQQRVDSMVAGDQLSVPTPPPQWMGQSGDWNNASNWAGGIPNGVNASANFLGSITAPVSVDTDVATTVGSMTFNNANTYVIGGAGLLAMQVSTGAAAINVESGSHEINLPLTFVSNTNIGIANGSTLTIGNPATINAGKTVTVTGNLTDQAPMTIGAGGELQLISGTTSLFGAPSLGAGAKIDIGSNTLTINYAGLESPVATIAALIASGYNNGAWNGPGIISSAAQTPTNGLLYGVGYADSADGVVGGLASGQIEVKYTLLGDANLDGVVNGSDFSILAANFGLGVTNWDQGNFLYGSSVNGSDFSALAANFGQGDSGAAVVVSPGDVAALDAFAAANGLMADVPEPASLGSIALGGCFLFARRRSATRSDVGHRRRQIGLHNAVS